MPDELQVPAGDQPWKADVELSESGAAELIRQQMPSLGPLRLGLLGVGWDNSAYSVNDEWVFRFPRRALGAALMAVENQILPLLAAQLPLPIPNPEHIGHATKDYAYCFGGYRLLAGQTACSVSMDDTARTHVAIGVAEFLRVLHGIDSEAYALAPPDRIARADMQRRVPALDQRLAKLPLSSAEANSIQALYKSLAETKAHAGQLVLSHGDLYARHVLVEPSKSNASNESPSSLLSPEHQHRSVCADDREPLTWQAAGIIDWGDLHRGDPALDLSFGYSFVNGPARHAFFETYGEIDSDCASRARFRAIMYGITLWQYGLEAKDKGLVGAGQRALKCAGPLTTL